METKKKPVLIVMAAGMGSRYGGLKQMDAVDDKGHAILDFSVFDAKIAGFEEVIFVIKDEIEKDFKELIGDRISNHIKVRYAFQDINDIPKGFTVPKDRTKPWGTSHAILSCKDMVDGPFVAINADDFYGRDAYISIYNYLMARDEDNIKSDNYKIAMVGYQLSNTVTDNGYVSRGVCNVDSNAYLKDIKEYIHIEKRGNKIFYTEDNEIYTEIAGTKVVSMNLWGCDASIMNELEAGFVKFLEKGLKDNPLKCEYYIPIAVDDILKAGRGTVKVLNSSDKWYGVTYHEDKAGVMEAIKDLKAAGKYPEELWK